MKKIRKKEKGITVIVLVITIIILLILASITIKLSVGDNGIIKLSKDVTSYWNKIDEDEKNQVAKLANKMKEIHINRGENDINTNKIGETDTPDDKEDNIDIEEGMTITYTPPTRSYYLLDKYVSGYSSNQAINQNINNWRVLNKNEDGSIELIAENTSGRFFLTGVKGYNNGVFLLNDIANYLYSNEELGITARSIKIEDIENKMNNIGIESRNSCTMNGTKYGNTMYFSKLADTYTWYPNILQYEAGVTISGREVQNGITRSETYSGYENGITYSGASLATSLRVTQSKYYLDEPEKCFDNLEIFNILFEESLDYYLASREISSNRSGSSRYAVFAIANVYEGNLNRNLYQMYESINGGNSLQASLRPIITIPKDLKLIKNVETGFYEINDK